VLSAKFFKKTFPALIGGSERGSDRGLASLPEQAQVVSGVPPS
jgi:hypothetical protein